MTHDTFPKDEVLDTAVALFRKFGFGSVAVGDILAKSRIPKEQLYEHFPSKEQLILSALERYDHQSRNFFARAVEQAEGGLRAKLMAFFNVLDELFDDPDFHGCLFINATVEYPDMSEPIHRLARSHKELFRVMMHELAVQHDQPDAEALSEELLLVFDAVCVAYQRTRDKKQLQCATRVAQFILDRYHVT